MIYYCEIVDTPKLLTYHDMQQRFKYLANTPKEAIAYFKQKHGNKLELVYDENFKTHYERNN